MLHTDLSSLEFGAILSQNEVNVLFHPLQYMSKVTSSQQDKNSYYELSTSHIRSSKK